MPDKDSRDILAPFRQAVISGLGTPGDYSLSIMTGVTPETAKVMENISRNQHAVPARQETVRHALTVILIAAVAVWLLWLLGQALKANSQAVTPLLWTIAAVVAVLGAEPIVTAIVKQLMNRQGS
jgi:hypothetical protein